MQKNTLPSRLANDTETYRRLNISPETPLPAEDGMRTDGREGSYEWWYTDTKFEDGTTVVVTFYTKNHFDLSGPAWPRVDIDIDFADGTHMGSPVFGEKGTVIDSSREKCDVRIGESYLKYDGSQYLLHVEDGSGIIYDAVMKSELPMWRPDTGHWMMGKHDEHFFAWFVAQPSSSVDAVLTKDGKSVRMTGYGYHDHNWGNIGMDKLMNHWYWGRVRVGGYQIIACDIVSEKKYGYKRLPVFMLAKDGHILTDDQKLTKIDRLDTITHPKTGKFMDNKLVYRQPLNDNESYTVTFIRQKDIFAVHLLDHMGKAGSVAKLLGFNPTYARILGQVCITHETAGQIVESHTAEGIWEQMFFGSNKEAVINE